jgi:hypothetical protein
MPRINEAEYAAKVTQAILDGISKAGEDIGDVPDGVWARPDVVLPALAIAAGRILGIVQAMPGGVFRRMEIDQEAAAMGELIAKSAAALGELIAVTAHEFRAADHPELTQQ